jgi:uncharacterized protein
LDITYDPAKWERTLEKRGLDFEHARAVFDGPHMVAPDERRDYGEPRFISVGELHGRLVVIAWTPRGNTRRVISMRLCHAKEAKRWRVILAAAQR